MKKEITIGNQRVELNSSAGWLYVYREQFGWDILPDLMPIVETVLGFAVKTLSNVTGGTLYITDIVAVLDDDTIDEMLSTISGLELTTMLNIFWALAKNADDEVGRPKDFVNSFDTFPVDEVCPEVFKMIVESSISSKNAKRLLAVLKSLKESGSRSLSMSLQSQELTEG